MLDPRPLDVLDFSVIVPTHIRPRQLAMCIAALQTQNYPADKFEIIVVHDGEHPNSDLLLSPDQDAPIIKSFQIPKQGVSAARNYGVRQAVGRWLAFTDDDCTPDADWLLLLGQHLATNPLSAVGGSTINALSANHFANTSATLESYIYAYQYQRDEPTTQQPYFAAKNLALPRLQFLELGGYDIKMQTAEDRDLCDRLLQAGYELCFVPEAQVKHHHDLKWRSFLNQHFNYGWGNFHYHRHRQNRGGERNRIESLRFYKGLLAVPWQTGSGIEASFLTLLLIASQAANAAGYLWAWMGSTNHKNVKRVTVISDESN